MARWRLTQPHYLSVPETEWEHKEVDRDTGRQVRKVYEVPRFLDPRDPADWSHKELEAIIVCHEGRGDRRDIVFHGEPTPDMEPLDAEAEAISEARRARWIMPMSDEALPAQGGYGEARFNEFLRDLQAMMSTQQPSAPVPAIDPEEFRKLQEQVAALVARNSELEASTKTPRRV